MERIYVSSVIYLHTINSLFYDKSVRLAVKNPKNECEWELLIEHEIISFSSLHPFLIIEKYPTWTIDFNWNDSCGAAHFGSCTSGRSFAGPICLAVVICWCVPVLIGIFV